MIFNTFRKIPVLSQYLISGPSVRISWSLRQISFLAKFFKRKPPAITYDLNPDTSNSTDSQKSSSSLFRYQGGDPVTCYHKPLPLADHTEIFNPKKPNLVHNPQIQRSLETVKERINIQEKEKIKAKDDDKAVDLSKDKADNFCSRKPIAEAVAVLESPWDNVVLLANAKPNDKARCCRKRFPKLDPRTQIVCYFGENSCDFDVVVPKNTPKVTATEEIAITKLLRKDESEEKSNASVSASETSAITNSLTQPDSNASTAGVAASKETAVTNSLREDGSKEQSNASAAMAITNSLREDDFVAKSNASTASVAASKETAITNSLREGKSEAKTNACSASVAASKETAITNSLMEEASEVKSNAYTASVTASKETAKMWKDDSITKAILLIDDGKCGDKEEDLIQLPEQVLNSRSVFGKEQECEDEMPQKECMPLYQIELDFKKQRCEIPKGKKSGREIADPYNCVKKFSMQFDSATLKLMAVQSFWDEQEKKQPKPSSKFESSPTRSLVEHILRKEVGNAFLSTRYLQVFSKANYSQCGRCGHAKFQGDTRRRNRRYEFYDSENASGQCSRCRKYAAFEDDCECCSRYDVYKDPASMYSKDDMPQDDEEPIKKTEEELYEEMCKKDPASCIVPSRGEGSWDAIRTLPLKKKKKSKKFVRRPPKRVDKKLVAVKKACIRKKISSVKKKPKKARRDVKKPSPTEPRLQCQHEVVRLQPPQHRRNYLEKHLVQPKKISRFFSNKLQEAVEPKLNSCKPAEKIVKKTQRRPAGYLQPAPNRPREDDVRNEVCRRE